MNYATVCTGGEAFGPDWHSMGYNPIFHSEIELKACELLRHRFPGVPNLGDFTTIDTKKYAGSIQLLAGGTPCQAFSIAGLGEGLADARGQLTLSFLELARALRVPWILWENVPGVLSNDGGRAFAAFLGGLAKLGYGFAYRILDAQYFGVPQRRRRVFVVGYLGDWRRAAAVLFESESLQRNSAPSRKAGQEFTRPITASTYTGGGTDGNDGRQDFYIPITGTLSARANGGGGLGTDFECAGGIIPINTQIGLRGPDTSNTTREGLGIGDIGDPMFTLQANHGHAVAFDARQSDVIQYGDNTGPLDTCGHTMGLNIGYQVRRLTPVECERLQGFPENWTEYGLSAKGKLKKLTDGARYKIIGNAWAVPVANYIANRIKIFS